MLNFFGVSFLLSGTNETSNALWRYDGINLNIFAAKMSSHCSIVKQSNEKRKAVSRIITKNYHSSGGHF